MVVVLRAGQQVLKNGHFLPKRQNVAQKYTPRVLKNIVFLVKTGLARVIQLVVPLSTGTY